MTEVTLVVESYTLAEGGAADRFRSVLTAATAMVEEHGDAQLVVTDASGDAPLAALLVREFASARVVDARGLGYDEAKLEAACRSESELLVYLDGDCVPGAGWLDEHVAALRAGAHATSGLTVYEGGWWAAIQSVLDFGFMLPARERVLACYVSNNVGFRRATLVEVPHPGGPIRCSCYAHARQLSKRGTPVRMVPGARVRHEPQPLLGERYRQGFDLVAACWVDPTLPEARLLRLGVLAAPYFYAREVAHDWQRLLAGRRDLGLAAWQAVLSLPLFPLLRLLDLAGVFRALAPGGRTSGVGLRAAPR